jgi:prepilin-type N-terminal cleavage/methylation domain-containing protein
MKKYSAFTLLEVLITVAIVSVLALVAFPSFTSYSQNSAMVANTSALLGSLKLARSEAITRGKRVSICASANGSTCSSNDKWEDGWVMWVDASSDNTIDSGEKIIRVVGKAKGTNVTIGGLCGDFVVSFISTGLPQAAGLWILNDIRGDSEAKVIRAYASGRIRVLAFGASKTWTC